MGNLDYTEGVYGLVRAFRNETAVHQLQCYIGDPVASVDQALTASPGFVMGHVLKAYLHLLGTEPEMIAVARDCCITASTLSIEKIRRTLHLFEVLRVIWWETPDLVRLRHRHLPWAYRSTPPPAVSPKSPWLETQR